MDWGVFRVRDRWIGGASERSGGAAPIAVRRRPRCGEAVPPVPRCVSRSNFSPILSSFVFPAPIFARSDVDDDDDVAGPRIDPKSLCNACGIRLLEDGVGDGDGDGDGVVMKPRSTMAEATKRRTGMMGEEEERAAVLLMALSSGFLYA
uniref:GATA-type domain-containing protein n=1 Tax=Ananas comosus var. bracteatus TaxID=296719 RepID=A0A6V7PFY1_ANACO|nr:unnamed protein product [Ananas comosus var. bracteatus]